LIGFKWLRIGSRFLEHCDEYFVFREFLEKLSKYISFKEDFTVK